MSTIFVAFSMTLLIIAIVVGFCTLGLIAFRLLGTIQPAVPPPPQPPVQSVHHVYVHQLPSYGTRTMIDMLDAGMPESVQRAASKHGGAAQYDYEQARWLIVDPHDSQRVLATQRKQLTG